MTPILKISDGTTTVDLLAGDRGYQCDDWTPAIAQYKGGGVFQSSPIAGGRRLVTRYFGTTVESFALKVKGATGDSLIKQSQELRRLLEKAVDYWASDWQDDPVWIEAKADCETNSRYAIIVSYSTPNDDNPFAQPFLQPNPSAVFDDWTLVIERDHWQSNQPGNSNSTNIAATDTYDSRTLGRAATAAANEVYIGNKENFANLTDVYAYTFIGAIFSANLLDAALPYNLLPAVPAVDDALYCGIDTSLANSGPFSSLVFDIGTAQSGVTGVWEYWDSGAWTTLTVRDNTDTIQPLDTTGVNSVSWVPPGDWATTTVNAITGYWVRMRVTVAAAASAPTQQNRDVYSVTWASFLIADTEIRGDIPALVRMRAENEGYITAQATGDYQRLVLGLRGTSRGDNFSAYINLSDEQNDASITVNNTIDSSFVNDIDAPSGRSIQSTLGSATSAQIAEVVISETIASDYKGAFRLFIRATSDNGTPTSDYLSLTIEYGFHLYFRSDDVYFASSTDFEVLDFGKIRIPPFTGEDRLDGITFNITLGTEDAAGTTVRIHDLILIPVDEWAIDARASDLTEQNSHLTGSAQLDIDSVSYPKDKRRALARLTTGNEPAYFSYTFISNGNFIFQSNSEQRLWFIAMDSATSATARYFYAPPYILNSLRVNHAARYLSMRGSR